MSYISVDYDEGRRCAGLIQTLAEQVGAQADGADCALCHMLGEYAQKLRVLAADLLQTTERFDALDRHTLEQSAREQSARAGREVAG